MAQRLAGPARGFVAVSAAALPQTQTARDVTRESPARWVISGP